MLALLALDPAIAVFVAILLRDQVQMGPRYVGIGDHRIRLVHRAVGQPHARGALAIHQDLLDLRVELHLDAQLVEQPAKSGDDRHRCRPWRSGCPLTLQVVNQHVERRRVQRVATDEQRVEGESSGAEFVVDVLAHVAVDAAIGCSRTRSGTTLTMSVACRNGLSMSAMPVSKMSFVVAMKARAILCRQDSMRRSG